MKTTPEQREDDDLVDEMIVARLAELTPAEVLTVVKEMLGRTACRWCGSVPTVEESEGHWRTCEQHPARKHVEALEGHVRHCEMEVLVASGLTPTAKAELAALRRVEAENLECARDGDGWWVAPPESRGNTEGQGKTLTEALDDYDAKKEQR